MVDIKLLEDVIQDIDSWNYGDLKEIKILSEEEIKKLTYDLDNMCDNEILSLCVTALHHMRKSSIWIDSKGLHYSDGGVVKLPFIPHENKPYISNDNPLDVRMTETTGIDKCTPITCKNK